MLSQSNVLLNEGTYELDILLSSGQSLLSPSEISHAHNVSVQKIPDFFQIMPSSLSYRKNSNIDVSIEWSADFQNPFDSDGTHHEGVDDRESLLSCHFYADHSTSRMVVPAILIDNNKIQCRVSEHLMGPFFLTTLHDVLYITVALSGKGSDIAEIGKISVLRGYEVNCIEPHIILSGVDTNVTISGHNFRPNSNLTCVIGQSYYPTRILNSTLMMCEIRALTNIGAFNMSIQSKNLTMDYTSDSTYRVDIVDIPIFDDNDNVNSSDGTKYCQLRVDDNNYDKLWFTGRGLRSFVTKEFSKSMICRYRGVSDVPAAVLNDTHMYCPCGLDSMMRVAGSNFLMSLKNDGFASVIMDVGLHGSQRSLLQRNITFYDEPIFEALTSPFVYLNTRTDFEIQLVWPKLLNSDFDNYIGTKSCSIDNIHKIPTRLVAPAPTLLNSSQNSFSCAIDIEEDYFVKGLYLSRNISLNLMASNNESFKLSHIYLVNEPIIIDIHPATIWFDYPFIVEVLVSVIKNWPIHHRVYSVYSMTSSLMHKPLN
jgi:hypothetical protein